MSISVCHPLARLLSTLACGAALGAPQWAEAASFTLNGPSRSSSIGAALALGSTVELSDIDRPIAVPASGTTTVTQSRVSATTTYTLSEDAFDFGFAHVRRNSAPFTQSEIELFFRPDADVDFAFSGLYSTVDGTGHPVSLSVLLNDLTTSTTVYASYDFSQDTPNEVFALGQGGGEFSFLAGSPIGRLFSGHDYSLSIFAGIEGDPLSDTGVFQGSGSARLAFIPEPGTALLLGFGLAALSVGGRQRAGQPARREAKDVLSSLAGR